MRNLEGFKENSVTVITVSIIRDSGKYMAKCHELDLVTEMDSEREALKAMIEMIGEYAEDYRAEEAVYLRSPNRAHHKPYVDMIMACQDELFERLTVITSTNEQNGGYE